MFKTGGDTIISRAVLKMAEKETNDKNSKGVGKGKDNLGLCLRTSWRVEESGKERGVSFTLAPARVFSHRK